MITHIPGQYAHAFMPKDWPLITDIYRSLGFSIGYHVIGTPSISTIFHRSSYLSNRFSIATQPICIHKQFKQHISLSHRINFKFVRLNLSVYRFAYCLCIRNRNRNRNRFDIVISLSLCLSVFLALTFTHYCVPVAERTLLPRNWWMVSGVPLCLAFLDCMLKAYQRAIHGACHDAAAVDAASDDDDMNILQLHSKRKTKITRISSWLNNKYIHNLSKVAS